MSGTDRSLNTMICTIQITLAGWDLCDSSVFQTNPKLAIYITFPPDIAPLPTAGPGLPRSPEFSENIPPGGAELEPRKGRRSAVLLLLPSAVVVVVDVVRGVRVAPPSFFSVSVVLGSGIGVSSSEDCFDGKIARITSCARPCQQTWVRDAGLGEDAQGGTKTVLGLYPIRYAAQIF